MSEETLNQKYSIYVCMASSIFYILTHLIYPFLCLLAYCRWCTPYVPYDLVFPSIAGYICPTRSRLRFTWHPNKCLVKPWNPEWFGAISSLMIFFCLFFFQSTITISGRTGSFLTLKEFPGPFFGRRCGGSHGWVETKEEECEKKHQISGWWFEPL